MKITCDYCGRPNEENNELCKSCGAPIQQNKLMTISTSNVYSTSERISVINDIRYKMVDGNFVELTEKENEEINENRLLYWRPLRRGE